MLDAGMDRVTGMMESGKRNGPGRGGEGMGQSHYKHAMLASIAARLGMARLVSCVWYLVSGIS